MSGVEVKHSKLPMILVGILVLVLAGVAGFFSWKYIQLKNSPSVVNGEANQRVLEKVGRIYEIAGDEEPTVALVQDKDKLQNQNFFAKAQNGDYIVILQKSKMALLYREKDNKLLNAGPIAVGDEAQEGQVSGAEDSPVSTPNQR